MQRKTDYAAVIFARSRRLRPGRMSQLLPVPSADSLGAVIPGATVALVQDGKDIATTTSDANGKFNFKIDHAGRYYGPRRSQNLRHFQQRRDFCPTRPQCRCQPDAFAFRGLPEHRGDGHRHRDTRSADGHVHQRHRQHHAEHAHRPAAGAARRSRRPGRADADRWEGWRALRSRRTRATPTKFCSMAFPSTISAAALTFRICRPMASSAWNFSAARTVRCMDPTRWPAWSASPRSVATLPCHCSALAPMAAPSALITRTAASAATGSASITSAATRATAPRTVLPTASIIATFIWAILVSRSIPTLPCGPPCERPCAGYNSANADRGLWHS